MQSYEEWVEERRSPLTLLCLVANLVHVLTLLTRTIVEGTGVYVSTLVIVLPIDAAACVLHQSRFRKVREGLCHRNVVVEVP